MSAWNHRKWGSREDPVRQSTILQMVGEAGCWQRVLRDRELELSGGKTRERASWRGCIGSAVHLGIQRYLESASARARIFSGEVPSVDACREVVRESMLAAAEGLPIDWYDANPDDEIGAAAHMLRGALVDLPQYAVEVVAVEAPFLVQLGDYWLSGTSDLLYRPRSDANAIAIADWKTGQQRLSQIVLDHNWQIAIYAHAALAGTFYPDTAGTEQDRSFRVEQFPAESWIVHLRDHVPYAKKTTKKIERPEEVAFWQTPAGQKVTLNAGDRRGPAWYQARRSESDTGRLEYLIRKIVAAVRLGAFVPFVGEHCIRCPHKAPCLSDGHAVSGDERRAADDALRGLDLTGTGADEIAA